GLYSKISKEINKQNKNLWRIYISGKSYEKLKELIYSNLRTSMYYKFPTERRTRIKNSHKINFKANQYNKKPIFVYNLDGIFFILTSYKKCHISELLNN